MLALIRFEVRKLWTQKKSLAAFGVILAINALFVLAFWMRYRHPERMHGDVPRHLVMQLFNAYVYTSAILAPCMYMLFPMVLSIAAAYILAGEIEVGTVRMVLARPVSRWQILIAKFLTMSLYSAVMTVCLLGFSYLISSLVLKPTGDLIVFGHMMGLSKGIIVHGVDVAFWRISLAYLLAVPMLMSVSAMALMFAIITRHFTSAAILTTTVYFCSYVVSNIPLLSAIHPYLPSRYWPFWRFVFYADIPWDRIMNDAFWSGCYTAAFLGIAIAFFNARDF